MNKINLILDFCRDKEVLDLGCIGKAAGVTSPHFLHEKIKGVAKELLGVDIEEEGVEELKEEGYNMIVADVEDLKLFKAFDVIVAGELIEHLGNPGLFLKSVYKHMHKDSLFILTTPNKDGFYQYFIQQGPHPKHKKSHKNSKDNHVSWFCKDTIKELLNRYNFEVEDILFTEHFKPTTLKGKLFNAVIPNKWKEDMIVIAKVKQ